MNDHSKHQKTNLPLWSSTFLKNGLKTERKKSLLHWHFVIVFFLHMLIISDDIWLLPIYHGSKFQFLYYLGIVYIYKGITSGNQYIVLFTPMLARWLCSCFSFLKVVPQAVLWFNITEAELRLFNHIVSIDAWVNGNSSSWDSFRLASGWATTQQVEDLCYVEQKRDAGHDEHKDDEDGLLGGSRHEALYSERTWGSGAHDSWVHDEPVQVILAHDEPDLKKDSEKYGGHIGPQQIAFNLDVAFFVWVLGRFDHFTARAV